MKTGTMISVRIAAFGLALFSAHAALAYNNPSLEWNTIKTAHFEVHFHEGAEWTARAVAQVAEEINGPITELYGYEPNYPVHFVIRDTDDYANGAAYFYDNKVEIWATNLEFGFRGTTNWVRNVVTHEYTHIVSIQSSLKMPKWLPAVYFQLIDFEREKRSDVLRGYPRNIVSYPFSGVVIPPWFAEGVAQYQSPVKSFDCWDSHRDMILRSAVLEDKMLSYDEMGFFGKNGIENEQVYDHGFGLVSHIASRYGPESLRNVSEATRAVYRIDFDAALKKATGKGGKELYGEWRKSLEARYDAQTDEVRRNLRAGTDLASGGFMTVSPALSPDGRRIAYLSNKGSDFAGVSLYIMNRDGGEKKRLKGGVSSPPRFSPGGEKLIYSKKVKANAYGWKVSDLFVYDLRAEKETRLTHRRRAADPDFSPDGRSIVAVVNRDGTHRLVVFDAEGKNDREIFTGESGTQIYNPHYSPDGKSILFGIFEGVTRDIAAIGSDGTDFRYLVKTSSDERDAVWSADGKRVIFASDRSGIFNIYDHDASSGTVAKITNVIGGAFMPDLSAGGELLVYAGYTADGYGIYGIEVRDAPVETIDLIAYKERSAGRYDECETLKTAALGSPALGALSAPGVPPGGHAVEKPLSTSSTGSASGAGAGSEVLPAGAGGIAPLDAASDETEGRRPGEPPVASPYRPEYTPFQFYPRFVLYDGSPRLGAFVASNEILEKQNFFLGGSYGTNGEFDGFFFFDIRNLYPTLFADFIWVREYARDEAFPELEPNRFDFRYDLWQADFGARLEFAESNALTERNELSVAYTHAEYSVNIDWKIPSDGKFFTFDAAGWKYYIGNLITAAYAYKRIGRAVDSDINPRGGREFTVQYLRAFDKLFSSGEFAYGFRPIFDENFYNQYSIDWREYVALPYLRHTLQLRLYGAAIDKNVDDFFNIYLGGRDGLRGYTYYSIGGRKAVMGGLTYRFPVWRNIDRQFLHLYFRDLYGGIFYEAGNAWDASEFRTVGYEKSIGYEIRLSLGSYYIFPTTVSFVSAYSLDPVEFTDPGLGGTPITFTQDRGWSYYLTIGFGFGPTSARPAGAPLRR